MSDLDNLIEDVLSGKHSEGILGLNYEDERRFSAKFGRVWYNMCNCCGELSYDCYATNQDYQLQCLTEAEIKRLILLSLETGVDHLYEACKDHPVPPLPPGCLS